MNATTAPAAKETTPPASSNGSVRLLALGLVLNTLLLVGLMALQFLRPPPAAPAAAAPTEEHAPAEHAAAPAKRGPNLSLGEYVVRLRNPEAERYARFSFEVQLGSELDVEPVRVLIPQIRDSFILYLSSRSLEQVQGMTQLEATKAELLKRLDEIVPPRSVRALYMTDFVVQ
ncbi:MAG: flagellar basal body-associated FliL family protein [Myxococcota bacterium]